MINEQQRQDIDSEITDLVPSMILEQIMNHTHNGFDSRTIDFTSNKQGAITPPSGGATVDSQARNAINTIINTLKALGLTN